MLFYLPREEMFARKRDYWNQACTSRVSRKTACAETDVGNF